ncbi:unnamed protein product [Moneuplotes crassus]|uniref:Uncharacterized protein n=1 Tax=Euplotes crassus TaxID=5936 RepID=A0AAD1Y1R2_EUPCR|nr:unnamed protein product [Moneuplotes crassus]
MIIPEANTPLLDYEMKRVIEMHSAFITLCDSFALCYKEAEQLINMSEATFVIWDKDSKGLIDAIQLFSILCLYSKGRIEDKCRFLLNLYDFNQDNQILPLTLEFMLTMCMQGICKLFNIDILEEYTEEIQKFIEENYPREVDIPFEELLKVYTTIVQS